MRTFFAEYGFVILAFIAFTMVVILYAWLEKSYKRFEINFIAGITGTSPAQIHDARATLDWIASERVGGQLKEDINDGWD